MEKHVYFVRHGESDSNADGIFRGEESMLTEKGKEQAAIVAERVERIGVQALISSTYPRALDTAAMIADRTGLTIEPNAFFVETREASAMRHKHLNDPELVVIRAAMDAGEEDSYRHSDEETFLELVERGRAALALIKDHPAERICVVSHGAFLKIVLGVMVFRDAFTRKEFIALFRRLPTSNTGITYARYTDALGWQLLSWNDSAHLG